MHNLLSINRGSRSLKDRITSIIDEFSRRIQETRRRAYVSASTIKHLEQEYSQLVGQLATYEESNIIALYLRFWNSSDILEEARGRTGIASLALTAYSSPTSDVEGGSLYQLVAQRTIASLENKRIFQEDIVPLLIFQGECHGYPTFKDIDHVIVDEAQDYTLLQYEYIKRCLPTDCQMTIVGDIHQATNPWINLGNYDVLEQVFPERIKRVELTHNYRSSLEISKFACHILPGNPYIESVRSTGNKPKLIKLTSRSEISTAIVKLINSLMSKGYNSIAVLCKTRRDSEVLHEQLRQSISVSLLTGNTKTFTKGVFVSPIFLVKGLEFDVVIIADTSSDAFSHEQERNMLYTAVTRALHELYLCCSGMLSPLMPPLHKDLCEIEYPKGIPE